MVWFRTKSEKSDGTAKRMATTFKALCGRADFDASPDAATPAAASAEPAAPTATATNATQTQVSGGAFGSLTININLTLPDDPDGYEAIFESIRRQLFDRPPASNNAR